jgi:hypothetical protein
MFEQCFKDMFDNCIDHIIYAHNLSSFDAILIIKVLYKNYKVNPFFKDNKILNLIITKKIKNKNGKTKTLKFKFRCSLVLLPASLISLIKSMSIDTPKLVFPYEFVNKDNLEYKGLVPSYKYFEDQLNYEEYQILCNEYEDSY